MTGDPDNPPENYILILVTTPTLMTGCHDYFIMP